jgi:toxin ParE1/3/4
MPALVIVLPRARLMLLEAARWWKSNRPEAPGMLDDEVEQALRRIAEQPRCGVVVRGRDVRRVVLRETGYLLFYRVRPRAGRIEVLSLRHGRRGL